MKFSAIETNTIFHKHARFQSGGLGDSILPLDELPAYRVVSDVRFDINAYQIERHVRNLRKVAQVLEIDLATPITDLVGLVKMALIAQDRKTMADWIYADFGVTTGQVTPDPEVWCQVVGLDWTYMELTVTPALGLHYRFYTRRSIYRRTEVEEILKAQEDDQD